MIGNVEGVPEAVVGELCQFEDLVPRSDHARAGEKGDIVRGTKDEIGALPGNSGDDEGIAQFLALAIERHDLLTGMEAVVGCNRLLEKGALRPGFGGV